MRYAPTRPVLALLAAACAGDAIAYDDSDVYVSAQGFKPVSLVRPDKPHIRYFLLDAWVDDPDWIVTVSKRVGPYGTTYTRRRVDCRNGRFQTLASGDGVNAMAMPWPDTSDQVLIGGTDPSLTAMPACNLLGR